MKRVYWRPEKLKPATVAVVAVVALAATWGAEHAQLSWWDDNAELRRAAAERAAAAMQAIGEQADHDEEFYARFDPGRTGLVGLASSSVTSLPAKVEAKRASINPNFAAVVAEMLAQAGARRGDVVAVGYSGSFPALNTCVCAAIESMGLKPLIIHSAASSQFGANDPNYMWLDMEEQLYRAHLISFRSSAGTLGSYGDRAMGASADSRAALQDALDRHNVPKLEFDDLAGSIAARMAWYEEAAAGRPVTAYINVGGGAASIRGSQGKEVFGPGLTKRPPAGIRHVDCVAARFIQRGVPVIHLGDAELLAQRCGLDADAALGGLPIVVDRANYAGVGPRRLLAAFVLLTLLVSIRLLVWSGSLRLGVLRAAGRSDAEGELDSAETSLGTVELMV